MTEEEMRDVIHELIVVDTENGFVVESRTEGDCIFFTTRGGEKFKIGVEKVR